jgi:hypothetical protein
MERLLNNDRIRTLLHQADDATRLLARIGDGPETNEIREALTGILRDLGREVHVVWREIQSEMGPFSTAPDPHAGPDDFEFRKRDDSQEKTAEDLEVDPNTDIPEQTSDKPQDGEDLERWYTDEVEIQQSEPLFNPGEIDQNEADVPHGLARNAEDDVPVVPVDGFEVAPYVLDEPWVKGLREFIALLGGPPADGADLTEEASKVQWAATGLDARWAGFPAPVRTALLGLLASRARLLQERLEVDVGPRMALDRLRKHRKLSDLPSVAALGADRAPETGSWGEDARWWWRALTAGLDGGSSGG